MKANPDGHPRSIKHKSISWLSYTSLAIAIASCLTLFAYLCSAGWKVAIDIRKPGDAFTINQAPAEQLPPQKDLSSSLTNTMVREQARPISEKAEPEYIHPRGARPINYDTHLKLFNSIFIRHPACDPQAMIWTQMECSNFKTRAMKRFSQEWINDSYWDGREIIKNNAANLRINAELYK
ncbi:hypothetical protein [Pseudomonas sp. URMO17WK12:I2]|uniref:hypothetical protein n=1 Tax=Pseudomonas sp. URMO17WK12:I2 TaxID=1261623 RepID=UPI0011B6756D|nr:hypothetical protein [Pseudomonas sp. URMO17WK12:I2]